MYRLDLNFADAYGYADNQGMESDCESDTHSSDSGDASPWNRLGCRLLQRIVSFLPRQSDRRSFCLVSKDWALAAEPGLWAYPEFSTPQQLSSFLHVVSGNPVAHGRYIRGMRFTLTSHYDRHLESPYYNNSDHYTDAELPTLREIVQGRHVLSADPALMRPLLHGSDLTSPPLAFRFARMCSPIDSLSVYGFRLRDKHVVNDLMRWNLRELEIIGMPRKPLANLGFLLHSLRSLRSLRIESDQPLPADVWSPLSLRMPALHKLRIWAPGIAGSHLLRVLTQQAPRAMVVLHLVGPGNDVGDELVERVVQGSPGLLSLAVHGANITARSATAVLSACKSLSYLELVRDSPEEATVAESAPVVVSSRLSTLTLRNVAVQDSLVRSATSVATRLRTLHIANSACLTGGPVADLLRVSTCLVALGLYGCPLLSELALQGLADGPSAPLVRIVIVENCAVQSDGVERVLTAFPNVEHFTVLGSETLRQKFAFAFNACDISSVSPTDMDDGAEGSNAALPKPLPVKRSFNLVYPPDHFLCKQSRRPQVNEDDIQAERADLEPMPRAAADLLAPRQSSWNDASPRYFVPGLLAFAGAAEDISQVPTGTASSGRRRATTLCTDDQSALDSPMMQPRGGRMRSISELPSGTDIMTSRLDTESAPHSPPEHANLYDDTSAGAVVDGSGDAPVPTDDAENYDADTDSPLPSARDDDAPTFRALPIEDSHAAVEVDTQRSGFAAAAASAAAAVAMATAGYIFGTSKSSKELASDEVPPEVSDDTTGADVDRSLDEQLESDIVQDIAAAMSEDISTPVLDAGSVGSEDDEASDAAVAPVVEEPAAGDMVAQPLDAEDFTTYAPSEKLSPIPSFAPGEDVATEFHSADECSAPNSAGAGGQHSCALPVGPPAARSLSVEEHVGSASVADEPASEQPAADSAVAEEEPVVEGVDDECQADVPSVAVTELDVVETADADGLASVDTEEAAASEIVEGKLADTPRGIAAEPAVEDSDIAADIPAPVAVDEPAAAEVAEEQADVAIETSDEPVVEASVIAEIPAPVTVDEPAAAETAVAEVDTVAHVDSPASVDVDRSAVSESAEKDTAEATTVTSEEQVGDSATVDAPAPMSIDALAVSETVEDSGIVADTPIPVATDGPIVPEAAEDDKAAVVIATSDEPVVVEEVDGPDPVSVDELAVSEAVEQDKADTTPITAEDTVVPALVVANTPALIAVSETPSADVEAIAEQPDIDSPVVEVKEESSAPVEDEAVVSVEEDVPDVSDVVAADEAVIDDVPALEETAVADPADEPSVVIADELVAESNELAVVDDAPASSLVVDEPVPEALVVDEPLDDDKEVSSESRSVEEPDATDAPQASVAAEDQEVVAESAVVEEAIQEVEGAVESAPAVEDPAVEPAVPVAEESTVAVEQGSEDEPVIPTQAEESPSEATSTDDKPEAEADESADPASDPIQVVNQPTAELVADAEEPGAEPRSVDDADAEGAASACVPTGSAPPSVDEAEPAVAALALIDNEPAARDILDDVADSSPDSYEPNVDVQPNEDPVAVDSAVEEKTDVLDTVDEKVDGDAVEASVAAEQVVEERALDIEEAAPSL
ncbi:hypothetical protein EV175_000888, partial [Coemansia sp. RSA 1933]